MYCLRRSGQRASKSARSPADSWRHRATCLEARCAHLAIDWRVSRFASERRAWKTIINRRISWTVEIPETLRRNNVCGSRSYSGSPRRSDRVRISGLLCASADHCYIQPIQSRSHFLFILEVADCPRPQSPSVLRFPFPTLVLRCPEPSIPPATYGLSRASRLTARFSSLACQVASVNASSLRSEFGPPPCQRSSVVWSC